MKLVDDTEKVCPRCGRRCGAQANFCGACAYTFSPPSKPIVQAAPTKGYGFAVLYIIGLLIVVLTMAQFLTTHSKQIPGREAINTLFVLSTLIAFLGLLIGLVSPKIYSRLLTTKATRKHIGYIFGTALFVSIIVVGSTVSDEDKAKWEKERVAASAAAKREAKAEQERVEAFPPAQTEITDKSNIDKPNIDDGGNASQVGAESNLKSVRTSSIASEVGKSEVGKNVNELAGTDKTAQLTALWKQGATAKQSGDYESARAAWQAALKLAPGHPGFQEAIDELPDIGTAVVGVRGADVDYPVSYGRFVYILNRDPINVKYKLIISVEPNDIWRGNGARITVNETWDSMPFSMRANRILTWYSIWSKLHPSPEAFINVEHGGRPENWGGNENVGDAHGDSFFAPFIRNEPISVSVEDSDGTLYLANSLNPTHWYFMRSQRWYTMRWH